MKNWEDKLFRIYKNLNISLFAILILILLCGLVFHVKNNTLYLVNYEIPNISNLPDRENFPSYGITRGFVLLMHGKYNESMNLNRNSLNLLIFVLINLAVCLVSLFIKSRLLYIIHPFLFLVSYFGLLGKIMKINLL
jgi:hypothetical protein